MLFATALTEDSMTANFADPQRFIVFDTLGREVIAVAKARDVVPVGFPQFDPEAFAPGAGEQRARAAIEALRAYTSHGAKTHSGVWRDLAVRKRKTEVDQQIAVIGTLGREAGIPTPAIDRLVELIHDVEDGRRPLSFATFQELIDTCTSARTAASPS
jgi:2-dehydropantoate 2-reductase